MKIKAVLRVDKKLRQNGFEGWKKLSMDVAAERSAERACRKWKC